MISRLARVASVAIVTVLLYLAFAQRVDAKEAINVGSLSTQEVEEQLQVCYIYAAVAYVQSLMEGIEMFSH